MNPVIEQIVTAVIVGISVVIAVCGIVRRIRRRGLGGEDCSCGCGSSCPLADKCDKNKKRKK